MIVRGTITVHKKKIAYTYVHENYDTLVLLLHGFGSDQEEKGNFDELSKQLLEHGIDSLRFDYLGHGKSEGNTEDVTISSVLQEAKMLLQKYPHKMIDVVGVSYGGGVATILANEINIERMVLWSPLIDYENNIMHPQNHFCREFLGEEAIKQIRENGYAIFGVDGVKFNMNLFHDAKKYHPKEILSHYHKPVKIIHGTRDIIVPYQQSLQLQSNDIEVQLIEGASHCFYDEFHQTVIQQTIEFLTKK